jgi:hypothetical protein
MGALSRLFSAVAGINEIVKLEGAEISSFFNLQTFAVVHNFALYLLYG